jgi:hypothetical protein
VPDVKKIRRDQQQNRNADKQEQQSREDSLINVVPKRNGELTQHINEII